MKFTVTLKYKLKIEPNDNLNLVELGAVVVARVEADKMGNARTKAHIYYSSTYPEEFYRLEEAHVTSEVINA